MELLFVSAFGLGIAFTAPPGAVNAEAVRRGLARGFWAALRLELGSLVGDASWAALALAGAAVLVQNPLIRLVLGAVGTCLLLHLAWRALADARRAGLPKTRPPAARGDFTTGALISLANPYAVAFWLGVGGGLVTSSAATPGPGYFAVFFAGFMLAALLWCVLVAALIAWGRRLINPTFFRYVNLVCGLGLGYFGLQLAWNTVRSLLT